MPYDVEHVLGYPSVRRVVDSIFGVAETPLSLSDAISGSIAILLLILFAYIALSRLVDELRRKFGGKVHPYVLRRKMARRGSVGVMTTVAPAQEKAKNPPKKSVRPAVPNQMKRP